MSLRREKDAGKHEPVAIIGIACRFPGGSDRQNVSGPDEYWELMMNKVDAITDVPADRWDAESLYHPDLGRRARVSVRQGGFLHGIDRFDAQFFGIPPVEAARMDPQQRILLEEAYMALEDAGLRVEDLSGSSTGVFVGISSFDYAVIQCDYSERVNLGPQTMAGIALSIAANRISYVFDLKGPSLSVDTACSSSLVATYLACKSIWEGASALALVGGVSLSLKAEPTMAFGQGGFLSPDARCKSFDASANGYIRSEGVGVVVLKPLAKAVEDGDLIYATIIGCATNQDGHTLGISAPSQEAQASVLQAAYGDAGIRPAQVHYVEAHGTGTAVGDPIEANATGLVVGANRKDGDYCLIGSVKSNIGHTEPVSGIAGLIKAALSLHNRKVPPNIHFHSPNSRIHFERLHLRVPTEASALPERGPLYAGVNSFGFGGSNAHIVLMSTPPEQAKHPPINEGHKETLFTLCACSEPALRQLAQRYIDFVSESEHDLIDICYTNVARRSAHKIRLATVVSSKEELADHLGAFMRGEERPVLSVRRAGLDGNGKICFVYSGQGPQWWGMGQELLEAHESFRRMVENIDTILSNLGWLQECNGSLLEELSRDESHSRINETQIAQPAIFAVQVGLTEVWRSLGLAPDAIVGHSVGEVTASYVSGALSLEDATRVVFWRSHCQSRLQGRGRMLAVGLSEEDARQEASGKEAEITLAAINGPTMVTLSGGLAALEELAAALEQRGIFNRFVRVDIPFHSRVMESIRDEFLGRLGRIEARAARIPLYSTVTGERLSGGEMDAGYWYRNLREPVRFYPAIKRIVSEGVGTFVEVSPHPILSEHVADTLSEMGREGLAVPSLRREKGEMARMLASLGKLFTWGCPLESERVFGGRGRFVRVPHYPWQRERYWLETEESQEARLGAQTHPHLVRMVDLATDAETFMWTVGLDKRVHPYIEDHRVQGPIVFPAAGHIDLAIAVGRSCFGEQFGFLEDINFDAALFLPDDGDPPHIRFEVVSGEGMYAIASKQRQPGTEWVVHSRGRINHSGDRFESRPVDLKSIRTRLTERVDVQALHRRLADGGLRLGPSFRGLRKAWSGEGEWLGEVVVPDELRAEQQGFNMHPAVLDACFQTSLGATHRGRHESTGVYIPYHIHRVCFHQRPAGLRLWAYSRLLELTEEHATGDLWLMDGDGNLVAEFQGFVGKYLKGSRGEIAGEMNTWFYEYEWQAKARPDQELRRDPGRYLGSPLAIRERVGDLATNLSPVQARFLDVLSPELDRLCTVYIVSAMRELGISMARGEKIIADGLASETGVAARHERFFYHLLALLQRCGYLKAMDAGWEVVGQPEDLESSSRLMTRLEGEYPELEHDLALLRRSGPNVHRVLAGQMDPVELLFPGSDSESLYQFYAHAQGMREFTEIMRDAVAELLKNLPDDQTIRVIEVGAGTGGMSQALLPLFPPEKTEYVFTDLSPMFFVQARERFALHPFVDYRVMDIEQDPGDQGIVPHSFDIVIASLVLHATRDIRNTLANVRRLLAPGGIVAMLEVANPPAYADLIFGMTDGWWLFQDRELRQDHCTMPPEQWQAVLLDSGFAEVLPIARTSEGDETWLAVILARNVGCEQAEDPASTPEAAQPVGRWLVFADETGVANALTSRLEAEGGSCTIVTCGDSFKRIGDNRFQADPHVPGQIHEVLAPLLSSRFLQGIVHCWSVDAANQENMTAEYLEESQFAGCLSVVEIVKALVGSDLDAHPHLWLVTAGAETPTGTDQDVSIAQAPLWGLSRTLINEHPDLPVSIVDLSPTPDEKEVEELFREIIAPPLELREEELAFRGKRRYRHRFDRVSPQAAEERAKRAVPASGYPYRTEQREVGLLSNVVLRESHLKELGEGEVVIDVHASALNFRDVMLGTGLLTKEAFSGGVLGSHLGVECSGRVRAIGAAVTQFSIGDEVVALAPNSLAGVAIASEPFVAHKPEHLSPKDAVTIPCVYTTAYYALNHLCRMAAGEKVLIHAAAGGVGLAAVRLAQHAGAEILATASTRKHDFLRSLGIQHVFDSRALDLKDQIMTATADEGVDIVLNSIAGVMIMQGLKCLAPYGRFVELGKTDIFYNTRVGLRPFGDNLSYFAVDINRLLKQKPELASRLLRKVVSLFDNRTLPLHPYTEFPMSQLGDALQYFAQSRHVGKVVVTMDEPEIRVLPPAELRLHKEATYLVVGGCGGFGLAVARWMAAKGAGHLVLMGRSGLKTHEDRDTVEQMRQMGIEVAVIAGDVAEERDVARVFEQIKRSMPPLRGIIQSAMVLDDATVLSMDAERFMRVIRPRVTGTWNLHVAASDCDLDFFVAFSSVSGILGFPGQSNYAASNAFLDKMSSYRQSRSLPATTIDWGVIGEVGFVARSDDVQKRVRGQGMRPFSPRQATAILERLILDAPAARSVLDVNWEKVAEAYPRSTSSVRFIHLYGRSQGVTLRGEVSVRDQLLNASDAEERRTLLEAELGQAVARLLGTSSDRVDVDTALTRMGIDSLMANQLRSWITSRIGVECSVMQIMEGPSIGELVERILDALSIERAAGQASSKPHAGEDAWVVRQEPRSHARIRLFCFPHLGAGASVFSSWSDAVSEDIELCVVQFPGREERADEPPITDPLLLREQLLEMVFRYTDKPFAFYGHSFGGAICFHLALELQETHDVAPEHVFIGAGPAPNMREHLVSGFDGVVGDTTADIPDDLALKILNKLGFPETLLSDAIWRERSMPAAKADLLISLRGSSPTSAVLRCPLTVFAGESDHLYPVDEFLMPWENRVAGGFSLHRVPGGHYFFAEAEGRTRVLDYIADALVGSRDRV